MMQNGDEPSKKVKWQEMCKNKIHQRLKEKEKERERMAGDHLSFFHSHRSAEANIFK